MSFFDRLKEMTYISPVSKKEFKPKWDTLERSTEKKSAVHEIVGSDIANVQDNGNGNQDYPHTLYFYGADYDLTADAFFAALREQGAGTLKHPRWGNLKVLPVKVHQKEDFVENVRMAVFEIDFIAAEDRKTTSVTNTAAAIQSAADTAAATVATGKNMASSTAQKLAQTKNAVQKAVKQYRTTLQNVTSAVESVRTDFELACRDIENGIDDLVEDPVALAQSVVDLARTPARMASSIKAKVDGYIALISDNIAALSGLSDSALATVVTNLAGAAIASCEAVTVGDITTRDEAIAVRDNLDASLATISDAFDQYYMPDPDVVTALEELRASTTDYLTNVAFSLPTVMSMTTDREYFPLELAYKLTGNPDDFPDIADFNGWGGDMLLVVPTNTEVRYYA